MYLPKHQVTGLRIYTFQVHEILPCSIYHASSRDPALQHIPSKSELLPCSIDLASLRDTILLYITSKALRYYPAVYSFHVHEILPCHIYLPSPRDITQQYDTGLRYIPWKSMRYCCSIYLPSPKILPPNIYQTCPQDTALNHKQSKLTTDVYT